MLPVLFASMLLAAPLAPPWTQGEGLSERLRATLDREVGELEGLSVAIAIGDEVLLCEGRGYVDAARGCRAQGETRWRAGALYPPLAALVLLRLAEGGRVALEDPVVEHLPALALPDDPIRVRHVLEHTSGLPSYVAWLEARHQDTPVEASAVVDWLATRPTEAHPGHCFSWSNSNALVSGALVEALTGRPLAEGIAAVLFEPLSLEDTGFEDGQVPARRAVHASYEAGGRLVEDGHALLPFEAESLCTTAPDLVRLVRGLAARRIVDDATWSALLVPARGEDGEEAPWSLGVGLAALDGHRGLVLGGGLGGDQVHVAYYPAFDLSIAVLAVGRQAPVTEIERRLARVVMDLPEPGLHDLPLSPEEVGIYVGDYYLGCTRLVVFAGDGSLWLAAPAEPDVRLRYQGRAAFVRDDDPGVRLDFLIEGPGARAHAFLLVARGAQSVARRLD